MLKSLETDENTLNVTEKLASWLLFGKLQKNGQFNGSSIFWKMKIYFRKFAGKDGNFWAIAFMA